MLARSRGATFRLSTRDFDTDSFTVEPDGLDSQNICSRALANLAKHQGWNTEGEFIRNMHLFKREIEREREKNAST